MCINLQTSILAFIIGETCGLLLATQNNEKRAVGIFIIFYSFIQLCEAFIYYYGNDNSTISSRLLLIGLGLQGIVFLSLTKDFINIDPIYYWICGLAAIFIIYKATTNNFTPATIDKCIKWKFMDNEIISVLTIMYFTIILFTQISKNKIINISGKYFIITLFLSLILTSYTKGSSPSMWCLASAITSPFLLVALNQE